MNASPLSRSRSLLPCSRPAAAAPGPGDGVGAERRADRAGTAHPSTAAAGRRARILILLAPLLAAAACTDTGDFGRPRPSLWNDLALPATGALAARVRGEPVSGFPLTDDEDALRDRAWRFLAPVHERIWFDGTVAALVRARVLPAEFRPRRPTAYHDALVAGAARSPASRYRRLGEDALADAKLAASFAATAARVLAADRTRLGALPFVPGLDAGEIRDAAARVAENRCVIALVRRASLERLDAYRHALDHLLIATPQGEAVGAERAVAILARHRGALDALGTPPLETGACEAGAEEFAHAPDAALPSAPLVTK